MNQNMLPSKIVLIIFHIFQSTYISPFGRYYRMLINLVSSNQGHLFYLLIRSFSYFYNFKKAIPDYLFANIQIFPIPPNKTHEKKQKCSEKQQTPRKTTNLLRGVWFLKQCLSPLQVSMAGSVVTTYS